MSPGVDSRPTHVPAETRSIRASELSRRKAEHLRLAVSDVHQSGGAGWSDVRLVHDALPAVSADDIDLRVQLLDHRLELPLVIAGMTGGHPDAVRINAALAALTDKHGIAMGLGSQRAALQDPGIADSYTVARDVASNAPLFANIGISQLVERGRDPALGSDDLQSLVGMIRADALVIHLNYLEECIQPEGQTCAADALAAVERAVAAVNVPVVIKETGSGLSRSLAERVRAVGVSALDVGGFGGTSFASIEAERARTAGDTTKARLGETFSDWGIPTPVCVAGCAGVLPVIATGGVRTGLDAARALALGATAVGVGRPLLQAALAAPDAPDAWVEIFRRELRTAAFLAGATTVNDLRWSTRVITGATAQWLSQLGYAFAPQQ